MARSRFIIYALVDPRTDEVRYIGKSTSGLARARAHGHSKALSRDRSHKAAWIKSLIADGLRYQIVVVGEFSVAEQLDAAERWAIAYARESGLRITNMTDGGDGCLGRQWSPETIERFRQREFTGDWKAKISESKRGQKFSEEHRAALARSWSRPRRPPKLDSAPRRMLSEEQRAAISARMKGNRNGVRAVKVTPERRRRLANEASSRYYYRHLSPRLFPTMRINLIGAA